MEAPHLNVPHLRESLQNVVVLSKNRYGSAGIQAKASTPKLCGRDYRTELSRRTVRINSFGFVIQAFRVMNRQHSTSRMNAALIVNFIRNSELRIRTRPSRRRAI